MAFEVPFSEDWKEVGTDGIKPGPYWHWILHNIKPGKDGCINTTGAQDVYRPQFVCKCGSVAGLDWPQERKEANGQVVKWTWTIAPDGSVSPSVFCKPPGGCGFHEYIKLVGYAPRPEIFTFE